MAPFRGGATPIGSVFSASSLVHFSRRWCVWKRIITWRTAASGSPGSGKGEARLDTTRGRDRWDKRRQDRTSFSLGVALVNVERRPLQQRVFRRVVSLLWGKS